MTMQSTKPVRVLNGMTEFQIVMLVIQGIAALAINAVWIGMCVYLLRDKVRDRFDDWKFARKAKRNFRLQEYIMRNYPLSAEQMSYVKKTVQKYKLSVERLCDGMSDDVCFDIECAMLDISDEKKELIQHEYHSREDKYYGDGQWVEKLRENLRNYD